MELHPKVESGPWPKQLSQWRGLVVRAAESHQLDHDLVAAMVLTESDGDTYALRYERGYRYLFEPAQVKPEGCSTATEINAQQCSWGLMQIMGATARELGFRGWMPELCRPEMGLEYGCQYLARQIKRYGGSVESGVAAYNAGNAKRGEDGKPFNYESYVIPIMRRMAAIKEGGHGDPPLQVTT